MKQTNQSSNNIDEITIKNSKKGKSFKKRMVSFCYLGAAILLVMGFSACSNKKNNSNKIDDETTLKKISSDDDYEFLEEFIEFINEYSDKPELDSQEEYDVFYKEQYDSWREGEAFFNIAVDENNHIVFASHVEKFVGNWSDTWSQRCSMNIDGDPHNYQIIIEWSNSATEVTNWYLTGDYDNRTGRIMYTGSCIETRYTEDSEEVTETIYENGTGSFYIMDGMLYWDDDIDEQSTKCVFEKYN